jgi:hypothetical protein
MLANFAFLSQCVSPGRNGAHLPRDYKVVRLPKLILEPLDRLAEFPARIAMRMDLREEFERIAQLFGADAQLVPLRRPQPRKFSRMGNPIPLPVDPPIGEWRHRPPSALARSPFAMGRPLSQAVHQPLETLRFHRCDHPIIGFLAVGLDNSPLRRGQLPLHIDVEIARLAEFAREPAKVCLNPSESAIVDNRPEQAERGTETAHGDSNLVQRLGIPLCGYQRLIAPEVPDTRGDDRLECLGDGHAAPQVNRLRLARPVRGRRTRLEVDPSDIRTAVFAA